MNPNAGKTINLMLNTRKCAKRGIQKTRRAKHKKREGCENVRRAANAILRHQKRKHLDDQLKKIFNNIAIIREESETR